MPKYDIKDYDDLTVRPLTWWESTVQPARKPYATASWAYFQTVEETLARVFVYDTYADAQEDLALIPQSIGNLSVDPQPSDPIGIDPTNDELGSEISGVLADPVGIDLSSAPLELVCDGDLVGDFIEGARPSVPSDDRPPGTLLGSVSYEISGDVATITDWEHLNWGDDTPVYKAVRVILNELPDCISEVKVLSNPTSFWTSLNFRPDFKGDQYLHIRM